MRNILTALYKQWIHVRTPENDPSPSYYKTTQSIKFLPSMHQLHFLECSTIFINCTVWHIVLVSSKVAYLIAFSGLFGKKSTSYHKLFNLLVMAGIWEKWSAIHKDFKRWSLQICNHHHENSFLSEEKLHSCLP